MADIIVNAERIQRYLADIQRDALETEDILRDAVERCLERICEAAHRMGPLAAELMPGQPWADIRGMGNRLRHAYDQIDLDVLWNTAQQDVPGLLAEVRRVSAKLASDRSS